MKNDEMDTDIGDDKYPVEVAQNAERPRNSTTNSIGTNNAQSTLHTDFSTNTNRRSTRDRKAPQRYGSALS